MSETKQVSGPRKIWETAVRTVKGDSTQNLVESFTEEMTLVAEGLCEDQAKLRSRLDSLENGSDHDRQKLESELEALETGMREQQKEVDTRLDRLNDRLSAMEKAITRKKEKKGIWGGWLGQVILLAAIVCGAWVIVTLINALKPS